VRSPLSVGVVADYEEEAWPSMDLAAGVLVDALRAESPYTPTLLRPRMPRPFGWSGIRAARNADRVIGRHWAYPRWLRGRAGEFALFHVADHSYAQLVDVLPAGRAVVTCHDLDAFRSLLEPARDPRPFWFRRMMDRVLGGMKGAAHVVCDSDAVHAELLTHGLLRPGRVTTVPLPVHPDFSAAPDPAADAEAACLLGDAPKDAIEVLHVGSTVPRKRIPLLLRAFARIPRPARLVRAGGALTAEQRRLASALGIFDRVVELPFLDRRTLAAVYRRAALVVNPSEREGFGLPLVEAMACGAPVLASDLPVLREVGRDAVRYVTGEDADEWGKTMTEEIARLSSPEARAATRASVLERASRFTLAAYGEGIAAVYARVLAAAPSADPEA